MAEFKIKDTEEMLNKYDEIINITMVNLYTLCKDEGKIVLSQFNRKNKDHLFILRVAMLAKDIFNMPLEVEVDFWDKLVLNWNARKISRRIRRWNEEGKAIYVNEMIDFMYKPIREYMGYTFRFGDIYDQFYAGELG